MVRSAVMTEHGEEFIPPPGDKVAELEASRTRPEDRERRGNGVYHHGGVTSNVPPSPFSDRAMFPLRRREDR